MTFGDRLRKLRKQHHMTQEQVAKSLNIVRSTYAYYETGKTRPDFNTVVRLAQLYNVTTDYLLDANSKVSQNDNQAADNYNSSTKKNLVNQWHLRESEQKLIIAYRYLDKNMQKEFLEKIEKAAAQLYDGRKR